MLFSTASGDVTVDPYGFAVQVEPEDELETEVILHNSGDDEVGYRIRWASVRREEEERRGPRRDDPGDVIQEIEVEHMGCLGIARDFENDIMWITHTLIGDDGLPVDGFFTGYRVAGNEVEVVDDIHPNFIPIAGGYYEGVFYSTVWGANNNMIRYDLEGNNLGDIDIGNPDNSYLMAFTVDPERAYLFVITFPEVDVHVLDINDDFEQVGFIDNLLNGANAVDFRGRIFWAPDHEDGHLWVSWRPDPNDQNFYAWQVNIDEEWNWEEIQNFPVEADTRSFGIGHDGRDLWIGRNLDASVAITDDGIHEPHWFTADPEEGVIAGGEDETIGILVTPGEEIDAGVYEVIMRIDLNDEQQPRIEIAAVMSVSSPVAQLSGTVVDPSNNDEAIAGVKIDMDYYIMSRYTDEEGMYSFDNLPLREYEFTFSAPDFLTTVETLDIDEEGEIELDIELLHAEFSPSREDVFTAIEPDFVQTFDLIVTNRGNGPLNYTVERRLLGGANAEPWELRASLAVEELVEDDMINGIVFTGEHYYISGGNNRNAVNKIYRFNAEGEYIDNFDQFHESDYGMRDLTFDGNLIWGADENVLYGFDTHGDLIRTIEGDAAYRTLTWDSELELFWSSDITSEISATNLNGEVVRSIARPGDLRLYGLAYWADDPDGHKLYVFSRGDEVDVVVYKLNLDNADVIAVAEFNFEGSRPAGIHITSEFDVYSWVLLGIIQTPDQALVWQLEARRDWFLIEPVNGVIEANNEEEFTITLDATGLPPGNTFEGEIVFTHDGVGGETILPVTMDVVEGEVPTFRELDLHVGWNTVSVNLQPYEHEDIRGLMSALVEEDMLIMMKNGAGQFYIPAYDFSNIPGWFAPQGYQLKMRSEAVFRLDGMSVLRDAEISLSEGWQLISYFPRNPVEATIALSGIENNLIIAKDGYGNFYIPDWNFSNMGDMCEGQGYYINVDAGVNLVYLYERPDDEGAFAGFHHSSVYDEPGQLPVHAVTGVNMSLLIFESTPPFDSPPGNRGGEIGIYADGELVGSGVLQNGICGISVWGDDPSTNETDGALEGQLFEIRLLSDGRLIAPEYTILAGETVYNTDGFAVVQLTASSAVPVEFGISSAYPNPFNSVMRISYGLVVAGDVSLNVYDLTGRHVAELVSGHFKAGTHAAVLDGIDLSSGVYLLRLESGGDVSQMKVALVK